VIGLNKVVYIVLTYNGGDMPIKAINDILSVEGENIPLILVDNGSHVDYSDYLQNTLRREGFSVLKEKEWRYFHKLPNNKRLLFVLERNRLYAGGNRLGAMLAYSLGYKIAIFSNDDIELKQPVSGDILEFFDRYSDVGIIGPNVLHDIGDAFKLLGPVELFSSLDSYKSITKLALGDKLSNLLFSGESKRGYEYVDNCIVVPWVSGAFFSARLEPLIAVNGFRYRRFLGWEEYELSEKMRRKGLKTVLCPNIGEVYHLVGQTTSNKKKVSYQRYVLGEIDAVSHLYGSWDRRFDIYGRLLAVNLYKLGLTPVGLWHKLKNLARRG